MNILYYGNCQLFATKSTLNLSHIIFRETLIECFNITLSEAEFLNVIQQQDIIITQPISDNYKDKHYLSTTYIINNCKKDCKIIIFDSCHFNFYYFDLMYKFFNDQILGQPIDYHYNAMIDCYKNNLTIDYYIENYVNNTNLKTVEELDNYAIQSLDELNKRHFENIKKYEINSNIQIISTYEYIKNNYKNKLLFYSMNHPTKYVIQYICEEIIKFLKISNTINYEIDILHHPKCIIYKCIQKVVNFDLNFCEVLTCNEKNIKDITQLYYDSYEKIGFH